MKFKELLDTIKNVGTNIGVDKIWICGGIPRDKLLNLIDNKISDIDLTTGDDNIFALAKEVEYVLRKQFPDVSSTVAKDGHISINFGNVKLDFSSNFTSPKINEWLFNKGIKSPTQLEKEMWSRDFTCNTLLLSLDLQAVGDPTGLAFTDIKNKILKTPMPVNITFTDNINRIPRTFYMACKLDFNIDESILNWLKANGKMMSNCDQAYVAKVLNKAASINPEKLKKLLIQTNMIAYVPATSNLYGVLV